jgi:nucleotide-binding universal stress UspA family protein
MFDRILLPLDGSEVAEMVLPYGEELAGRLGSELVLFRVRQREPQEYEHIHHIYLDRLAESTEHNIKRYLPSGVEVRVTTEVAAGYPAENICKLVEERNIGLIIMTSVGVSGLRVGKMLGSVTDFVCRTVPVPVMLIRPHDIQRIEGRKRLVTRIMVPLDGSDLSKLELPVAEALAARLGTSIVLFQMAKTAHPYATDLTDETPLINYARINKAEEERVRTEMAELESELVEKHLDTAYRVTTGNDAATEIIEMGKNIGADLVVMSTHGRSGWRRWIFGSVAEKVLQEADMPLVLVHASAS